MISELMPGHFGRSHATTWTAFHLVLTQLGARVSSWTAIANIDYEVTSMLLDFLTKFWPLESRQQTRINRRVSHAREDLWRAQIVLQMSQKSDS